MRKSVKSIAIRKLGITVIKFMAVASAIIISCTKSGSKVALRQRRRAKASIHVPAKSSMSEDHGIIGQLNEKPIFLGVMPGDTVVVFERETVIDSSVSDWFMATVLFAEGSARDPKAPSLFQVADIDTGVVRFVNADQVEKVML